jgi:ompA family protein
MFDEKGNLKQQPKPKKKESLDDDGMIIINIP